MGKYVVIKYFTDLHDKNYPYNVGDTFPREGIKVTQGRIDELSGSKNKQGVPLIKLAEEVAPEAAEEAEVEETTEVAEEVAPEEKPAKKTTKRGTKKAE